MATEWIMVRIDRRTHAALERVRESMRLGAEIGLRDLETDNRDRVSLDQVIRVLIEMRDNHAERRRRSAMKRKEKGRKHRQDEKDAKPEFNVGPLVDACLKAFEEREEVSQ
jgi:hypothetical protein